MSIFKKVLDWLFPPLSAERIKDLNNDAKVEVARALLRQINSSSNLDKVSQIFLIDIFWGNIQYAELVKGSIKKEEYQPIVTDKLKKPLDGEKLMNVYKIIYKNGSELLCFVVWTEDPIVLWTEKLMYYIPNPSDINYEDLYLVYSESKS